MLDAVVYRHVFMFYRSKVIIFSTNLSLVMLLFVVCVRVSMCAAGMGGGYVCMHAVVYMHVLMCLCR